MNNNATLLVVDDNKIILRFLEDLLKKHNYNVLKCISGEEAIDLLINDSPDIDLVITDYHMDQIDGLELMESIKKLDKYKKIGSILYTNVTDLPVLANKRFNIFNKVLYKTSSINSFIEEINIILFTKVNNKK